MAENITNLALTRRETTARFKDMIETKSVGTVNDVVGRGPPGDGLGAAGFDSCMFL